MSSSTNPNANPPPENKAAKKKDKPPGKKPSFTIERLRRDCYKLFGITDSTFDAAVFGLTGTYTVEEMKGKIKEFQRKPIFPKKKEDK